MEMTITVAELFLGAWAVIATIGYYLEKHNSREFKFKTAVIMKALAEGKAKFIKHGDGEFGIESTGTGE
jgi:hypothetical protein